jgi:hypothetical protein
MHIEQEWSGSDEAFFDFMRTIYPKTIIATGIVDSFLVMPDDSKLQWARALDFAGIEDYPCLF